MYQALIERRRLVRDAIDGGREPPEISRFLANCIIQIAEGMSIRHNYIKYSYRDEMVADAVLNGVTALDKFDPEKSRFPFAYFYLTIQRAFHRRIAEEKKQQYMKYKNVEHTFTLQDIDLMSYAESNTHLKMSSITDFISGYEEAIQKRKAEKAEKQRIKDGIDGFADEEGEDAVLSPGDTEAVRGEDARSPYGEERTLELQDDAPGNL